MIFFVKYVQTEGYNGARTVVRNYCFMYLGWQEFTNIQLICCKKNHDEKLQTKIQ